MISLRRWGWWKPAMKAPAQGGERSGFSRSQTGRSLSIGAPGIAGQSTFAARNVSSHVMPRPVIRWVAQGRVALRAFDFEHDASAVCAFQPETYSLNFPDFVYTSSFADAFRHDLRRAVLDANNALFVLDDGREQSPILGFLWVVICQNGWTQERYGYINNIFVVPEKRGQGLAGELLRQSDDWFRERGVKRVRLTVTQSNANAAALYEASGYHVQRLEMQKDL
jgi:ribosomal protein S18 acetylase RimI-like enzyme